MSTRREFLGRAALATTAGLVGLHRAAGAAEPPPETTRLKVVRRTDALCISPQMVAEDLLRGEGFADLQYMAVTGGGGIEKALAAGEADLSMHYAAALVMRIDAGDPVVVLAGGHVGCFELFATERVRSVRDLKGRRVAVPEDSNTLPGALVGIMLSQLGLNPRTAVTWVPSRGAEHARLLSEGKIDAFLAFPPTSQELRARKIGHVVLNSAVDRPWSQYFCCVLAGHREFVRKHPVATKRAARAILKAADLCALEPDRAARALVDRSFVANYDGARQMFKELPYGKWREFNPEETMRFYALRLHEAGLIKSTPQKILAQGTDWRFFNELRKELKG
jgi:NitT/TauT family transport system substrate-binding protein